jgi:hypothetical protein
MMSASRPTYTLVDARRPSTVSHLAVNPYFPLLALMLGGAWIGWPWFAFNAVALGSYTRAREIVVCAGAAVAVPACAWALVYLYEKGVYGNAAFPYLHLFITAIKLTAGYFVYGWQERAAQLREHYERPLRNGAGAVIVATWVHLKLEPLLATHNVSVAEALLRLLLLS